MKPAILENIEDIFPMSDIQKGMIYHSIRDGNKTLQYYNQTIYQVKYKAFDPDLLRRAYCLLIDTHPTMRTAFDMDQFDQPLQLVYKTGVYDISHQDISGLSKEEQRSYLTGVLKEDRDIGFDVGRLPLCRMKTFSLGGDDLLFFWVFHHVILDGWSNASFLTELNNTYLTLKEDPQYTPPALKNTYKAFVVQEMVDKKDAGMLEFWRKELEGFKRLDFSSIVRSPGGEHSITSKTFRLGQDFSTQLAQAAASGGTTVKNLCFAAYLYLLKLISYENDFTVGLVTHNRPLCADGDKILGCFLNTFPFRIDIPGGMRWRELIELVERRSKRIKKYERLPLFEIVRATGVKTDDRNPLFDSYFNFVDFHVFNQADQDDDSYQSLDELNREQLVEGEGFTNAVFDVNINTTFGGFELYFAYYREVFFPEFIDRLADYFKGILNQMITNPAAKIHNSDLLTPAEKRLLLHDFNDTETSNRVTGTVHREFERMAAASPHKVVIVCAEEDGRRQSLLTMEMLNARADNLAVRLKRHGAGGGRPVVLMATPSPQMIIGILGILKTGAAYLPVDPVNPPERIKYLLEDSHSDLIVSQQSLEAQAREVGGERELVCVDDSTADTPLDGNRESDGCLDDPLYAVYTSGTTGRPKGVLVNHRSMVNYVEWLHRDMNVEVGERTILTSSFAFDLGYSVIYPSLMTGGELHLVPKSLYVFTDRLLDYYGTRKINYIKATPSFFNAIANSPAYTFWNTRTLRFAILGGEVLTPNDIETALSVSPQLMVLNEYGPTEATIGTNIEWIDKDSIREYMEVPNIGRAIGNIKLFILNRPLELQPLGVVGELCVSGVCLAAGYLNRPELTAEKFPEHPLGQHGRIYRTGDFARWLPDGKIDFIGRIDQQVKVRGYRIELGEIEDALRRYPAIREAVATVHDNGGDKYICAYYVEDSGFELSNLRRFLESHLPDYMIPGFFIPMEAIPLNANGKVDKQALPAPAAGDSGRAYMPPATILEVEMTRLWADILDVDPMSISADASFFEVGGHSLNATVLLARIQKRYSVRIPWDYLFGTPTVSGLAHYVSTAAADSQVAVIPVEDREHFPLSPAQERLFVMQRMEVNSIEYNMFQIFALEERPDKERLLEVLSLLIQRHESLRTSFWMIDGTPVQRIHGRVPVALEEMHGSEGVNSDAVIEQFVRPFQLDSPPLIRLGIAGIRDDFWLLMMDVHHIVADGLSLTILERDFTALYTGRPLPPLTIQYRDFSTWFNTRVAGDLEAQGNFWIEQFSGGVPQLNVPADFARPKERTFDAGGQESFRLDPSQTVQLNALGLETESTLFMVLLAVFNVFLAKLDNQEAVVVGSPVSGRRIVEIQDTVGMFVNTLALKNEPRGALRFVDFLKEVKECSIQAFENQDYPFDDLVDRVMQDRQPNRNPLFDVMFALHNLWQNKVEDRVVEGTGMKLSRYPYERGASICDMIWTGRDTGETVDFSVQYNSRLFTGDTIRRFIDDFKQVVVTILEDNTIQLKEIKISHNLMEVEQTVLHEDEGDFDF
jgi:amino acid adenylation domain-containing protein